MKTIEKQVKSIPEPTLRRLPKYVHLLNRLKNKNVNLISSNSIADELGLDSIKVRKDLTATGIIGKPKIGYELNELLNALNQTLNWNKNIDAFLVGAGSLGSAIIGYKNFASYGLNIIAAFDNDPSKIGTIVNGIEILPIEKLAEMISRMNINIGVLTVPPEVAQHTAEIIIEAGIAAIWNFAPIHLKVSKEIIVENTQLSHSLGVLTYRIAEKNKKNGE